MMGLKGEKPGAHRDGWAVVLGGGGRMFAEEIRCLLAGRGLHPLVLNTQIPEAHWNFFGAPMGAIVIVPPHEREDARDVLRDAEFIGPETDLPIDASDQELLRTLRAAVSRTAAAVGSSRACRCGAPAEADSVYCDQCGEKLP